MTDQPSRVENTSARSPRTLLDGMITAGDASSYITGMEAAGQRQLVHSDQIPSDGDLQALRELGFVIDLLSTPGDELFRKCTFPEGWTREPSENSFWSYIVDAGGYRRVSIFYKAAFYDRSAHFYVDKTPVTKAQADAYSIVSPTVSRDVWHTEDSRRDGPNVVYVWHGRDADYNDDGRRLEVHVAPDGRVIKTAEFSKPFEGKTS